jgi:hypothetical protein
MSDKRLTLEVSRDGWTTGLQLSINLVDDAGSGDGYRLAGPKFNGSGEVLMVADLTPRDVAQIRSYIERWEKASDD